MEYLIPVGISQYEHEIKRSRFISRIKHIKSAKEARHWFAEVSDEFPDARHVCWAYIAGQPGNSEQAMNDDGEPAGTAGKPILNVLQHSDAGEIAAVVVRYFGGIKLGAGGLVRAYSTAAAEALKRTELVLKIPQQQIKLALPFSDESTLRYLLEQVEGQIQTIEYAEKVHALCQLPASQIETFLKTLPHSILPVENEKDR